MVQRRVLLVGAIATILVMGMAGGQAAEAGIDSVKAVNTDDEDGDGVISGFDLEIVADTDCLDCYDEPGSDLNIEPYFRVYLVGEDGTEARLDSSEVIGNEDEVSFTYVVDSSDLEQFAAQQLEVRVELWDEDVVFDDKVDEQSIVVDYEPPAGTTPTDSGEETTVNTPGAEQLFSESHSTPGLATAVSSNGSTFAYGQRYGTILLYDSSGDSTSLPALTDSSVTDIQLSDENERVAAAWLSGDAFGSMQYDGRDPWGFELAGLWATDATPDGETIAGISQPMEGPGTLGVASAGEVDWEVSLGDSMGWDVAITDNGSHVAAGLGGYHSDAADINTTGTNGVTLYTDEGERLWIHETDSEVGTVEIDAGKERIYAALYEGGVLVLNFDGEVIWEDDQGLELAVSSDGSTIVVSHSFEVIAFDGESGEEQWRTETGYLISHDDIEVSENGSRVLISDRGDGKIAVMEEGEIIWNKSYGEDDVVRGALAENGAAWSVIIHHDDDTITVEAYRDNNVSTEASTPS